MQLNITFRQFGASDSLKEYAREKVDKVNKYLDRAGEAHVVLSLERHLHHADITIHSGAWVLRGREKSEDMYASIDLAMDKIESQLRRYKEKLKHHHGRERVHHRQGLVNQMRVRHAIFEVPEAEDASPEVPAHLPVPAAAGPRIIRSNDFLAEPMSSEDAVMQMNLRGNDFLVFQNVESRVMNVVYRRKDGQYGLIDTGAPETAAPLSAG